MGDSIDIAPALRHTLAHRCTCCTSCCESSRASRAQCSFTWPSFSTRTRRPGYRTASTRFGRESINSTNIRCLGRVLFFKRSRVFALNYLTEYLGQRYSPFNLRQLYLLPLAYHLYSSLPI